MNQAPRQKKQLPAHMQKLLNQNNASDSAGVPWEGRELDELNFQNDQGFRDENYAKVRQEFTDGKGDEVEVYNAIASSRVLIPLEAYVGDEAEGAAGLTADKSADMAMIFIQAPDGRKTLPVFTDVNMMKKWNKEARPVPVEAGRAALAGAGEEAQMMVIDPGEHDMWLVRRPAMWAMAQGKGWVPAYENPQVKEIFDSSILNFPDIRAVELAPAATVEELREGKLGVVELRVTIHVKPGLSQQQLQELVQNIQTAWAHHPLLTEYVDSMEMKVVTAGF
ncbi:MAG: SseB family protein [Micrococcaceae bacterium]